MDQARHPAVQVVINGHSQAQAYSHGSPNGTAQRAERPLSVDEALQYSPMTSSPVFGLGRCGELSDI